MVRFKLTIVIITVALIITASVLETVYIKNTFEELEEKLLSQMNLEKYDENEIADIENWWTKKAEILEIFISVLQLNEITVTLGELRGAAAKDDSDTAAALVDRTYNYATRICDMYMLKFNNIF